MSRSTDWTDRTDRTARTDRSPPADLTAEEVAALHEIQLGIEYVYQAFGCLLAFHHDVGRAMNRFYDAERFLREAGHIELADELRDRHLPAGAVGDHWSYELVDDFRHGFLTDMTDFETRTREGLADGVDHVGERSQQADWRARAETDDWRVGSVDD
jgi:hypothetical protein